MKLLIVEDEKLIRQGIKVMVQRSSVEIEEIIECKNGEEALVILRHNKIDIMITDIRMPKMDGMELVSKVYDMPYKPEIIVVSGYDDFNYAVKALRKGVREYLLKPIEREKLHTILIKIKEELESKNSQATAIKQIGNQQFKYLILNQEIKEKEVIVIEKQFSTFFLDGKYVVCCCNWHENLDNDNILVLNELEGGTVLILEEKELQVLLDKKPETLSIGISRTYEGIRQLRQAYIEAVEARKEAFVKSVPFYHFRIEERAYKKIGEKVIQHFVQCFGTAKIQKSISKLRAIRDQAESNEISPNELLIVTDSILNQLINSYKRIIEYDMQEFEKLRDPLQYKDANEYYALLEKWMVQMQQVILDEFNNYRNKEKINQAIQYIHENYANDLNMAVVSNHISMNYSLFSLNFKQYTGVNFVNYLKKIRIEEAKKILKETEEKIIDISQMVGYYNEKHFMKTFKSICGVTPTEYRKNMQMNKR